MEKTWKEKGAQNLTVVGWCCILLGTLSLLASVGALTVQEKTDIQVMGILLLIGGSLAARSVVLLLFSFVSIVLVAAGYPQIPAILVVIPFLLAGLIGVATRGGGGSGGRGGETKDTVEQKHYDRYGRYKDYSKQHGDIIEHYDESGTYRGHSERHGNIIRHYDECGRFINESEEKRPPGQRPPGQQRGA